VRIFRSFRDMARVCSLAGVQFAGEARLLLARSAFRRPVVGKPLGVVRGESSRASWLGG